jgi:hypothetical protein
MAALARNIENRKRCGKRTLIYKNNAPFSRAKIASHLKKDMTMDQLLRKAPSRASMPAGFRCITPPPEKLDNAPSSITSASTPDQVGFTQTPPTSSGDTGLSSSEHIPTPQSTPYNGQEDSEAPTLLPTFEALPPSNDYPWTIADPIDDFGLELFRTTGQGFQNPTPDYFPQSAAVDISGEALFLSSPTAFPPSNVLDVNFHMSMSTYMQSSDSYSPLRCHQAGESQRYLPGPSDPQPEVFVSFCCLACILHGQGQEQGASTVSSEAFKIYRSLIKQKHEQALACLNLVLAVLFMHGQSLFAVDLLKNAHQTALCELPEESPIIVTISFMVQQASRTVKQCGITPARLRVVFDDFKESQTLKHPYTILAGYHLAWRLAMDGGDGLKQARQLLSELQGAAECTFGKTHMQTIAILTTKARVLHDLKYREEAEELMSKAITRIEMGGYLAKHPYALEAKRRHSIFLYAVNKIPAAEKRLIEVVMGRVEVLGLDHAFSKESVKDVESFLCTPGRETELSEFAANLTEATVKSALRNSTTRTLQFW